MHIRLIASQIKLHTHTKRRVLQCSCSISALFNLRIRSNNNIYFFRSRIFRQKAEMPQNIIPSPLNIRKKKFSSKKNMNCPTKYIKAFAMSKEGDLAITGLSLFIFKILDNLKKASNTLCT